MSSDSKQNSVFRPLPSFRPDEIIETFAGFLVSVEIKDEPCPEYHRGRNVLLCLADGSDFGCQFRFFWLFPAGCSGSNLKGAFQTLEILFDVAAPAFVVRNKANDLQYFVQGSTVIQGALSGFGRNLFPCKVTGSQVHYADYYREVEASNRVLSQKAADDAVRQAQVEADRLMDKLAEEDVKWD